MINKRLAAFTIAQNEDTFLEIWAKHYSAHIPKEDLYILNHNSTTESSLKVLDKCRQEGINVIPVHRFESFNHEWLKNTVEFFQKFLLQNYQAVLFAEADELIFVKPSPTAKGLVDFIMDKLSKDDDSRPQLKFLRCFGFSIDHVPSLEAPIDFTKPILEQRKYWRFDYLYCKALISNVHCHWTLGFHHLLNCESIPIDMDLMLLHLHKVDYEHCKKKHREQAERKWSKLDLEQLRGLQNRTSEGEAFDKWFFGENNEALKRFPKADLSSFPKDHNSIKLIPDFMIGVV